MIDNFNRCLAFTLREEGGYVDNVSDPGGATNMGITLETLRDWFDDPDLQRRDIQTLTESTAAGIYCVNFWNRLRCDTLPSGVDLMVFDFSVNTGCQTAARLLQRAVGLIGAEVDGCVGPFTLRHAESMNSKILLEVLRSAQQARYEQIDDFVTFGHGWLARTARRFAAALEMTSDLGAAL